MTSASTPNTRINTHIAIAALAGITLGGLFLWAGKDSAITSAGLYACSLISTLFIDLLKMLLVPLIVTSIIAGIMRLHAQTHLHRIWQSTLLFSLTTLSLSTVLGLLASNWLQPGAGLSIQMFQHAMTGFDTTTLSLPDFFRTFLHSLFMNPIAAMAQNSVLAMVTFALFVGAALAASGERYPTLQRGVEEAFALTMQITQWIMWLAPFGIAALLAKLVATESAALLGNLVVFITMVLGTTLLHGLVILPAILFVMTRLSPLRFWRATRPALLTAFATSSSSATMPVTLSCLENALQVRPEVARFVVPVGAHLNMDGTVLYEAAAALFVAQLCGIELSLLQQLIVCLIAMLASIGAPGIPSAGMITMVMVLQSVGLPAEAIALLLPIDRLLDTVRTMVNVEGDMVSSLVVQKIVYDQAP